MPITAWSGENRDNHTFCFCSHWISPFNCFELRTELPQASVVTRIPAVPLAVSPTQHEAAMDAVNDRSQRKNSSMSGLDFWSFSFWRSCSASATNSFSNVNIRSQYHFAFSASDPARTFSDIPFNASSNFRWACAQQPTMVIHSGRL